MTPTYDRELIAEMLEEYAACRSIDLRHQRTSIADQITLLRAADNAESRADTVSLPAEGGGVDELLTRLRDLVAEMRSDALEDDKAARGEGNFDPTPQMQEVLRATSGVLRIFATKLETIIFASGVRRG